MKNIAVMGGGVMARGIAQCLAEAGLEVTLFDILFTPDTRFLLKARENIMQGVFSRKNAEGKLVYRTREAVREIFEKIEFCDPKSDKFNLISSCDAIIEAITENIDLKKKLYQEIESRANPDTPIFTNTSVIQIKKLAEGLKHPERFMGLHFFNPVPLMKPVEVISGLASLNTKAIAIKLVDMLRKEFCPAPDRVGFIVNGCMVPMIMALDQELKSGADFKQIDKSFTGGTWYDFPPAYRIVRVMVRTAEAIVTEGKTTEGNVDALMRLGLNMPYGPFEIKKMMAEGKASEVKFKVGPAMLCDHVGLDVALDCCKMFKLQEPNYWLIPEALEKLLAEGKKGKKSGEGFYEYEGKVKVERLENGIVKIGYIGDILHLELIKKLRQTFLELKKDSSIKNVLFEIRAKGANIKEFPLCLLNENNAKEAIDNWHFLIQTIIDFPKPVLALVQDYALGGGYELALACDYIVAKKGSRVGLPEVGLGILPGGGGTQTLTRRVGFLKALWMILGARVVEASCPWVNCVIPEERFASFVKNIASEKISIPKNKRRPLNCSFNDRIKASVLTFALYLGWKGNPPTSFWLAKKAILEGNQAGIDCGLGDEFNAIIKAFETRDAEEGVRAFLEKRKPLFQGK